MQTPLTDFVRTVQTVVDAEGIVTVTTTTVASTKPEQEPKAPLAEPKVPSKPKASKATKSPRKSKPKASKKTTKSSKAKFSVAEIRAMVTEGQFYQAISACRDQGWDPSKTDGRLRPKADKPTKSASKSTKSTKKAASKKPSAPKPKASAKAERPVDQEPKAPAKSQKLSASQQRNSDLRVKLGDTIATFGGEVDEVLTDFIAKPHAKHVVVKDHDMLLDTWIQLGELDGSKLLGQADDEVVRLVGKALNYVEALASKAGLA